MQLLFVHGSGGCKESWRFQMDHFKDAEAINLPGHPDGELCASIADYAAWLHRYIQKKGYQDVVLVGHSMGGGIVLQYALDYPGNLAAVVTIGSGGRLRVHPDVLAGLATDPAQLSQFNATSYGLIDPELAKVLRQRDEENTAAALLNDLKACDSFDIMERLGEINLPFLALVGDQDVMTPPKYSAFMVDKIAGAKQVVIPGGMHFVFAEKSNLVNEAIDTFIRGLA